MTSSVRTVCVFSVWTSGGGVAQQHPTGGSVNSVRYEYALSEVGSQNHIPPMEESMPPEVLYKLGVALTIWHVRRKWSSQRTDVCAFQIGLMDERLQSSIPPMELSALVFISICRPEEWSRNSTPPMDVWFRFRNRPAIRHCVVTWIANYIPPE